MTPNSIRQLKSFVTTDRCSLSHLAYLAQFAEPLLLVGSSLIIARQNRENLANTLAGSYWVLAPNSRGKLGLPKLQKATT